MRPDLVAPVALLLAACGGGDGPSGPTSVASIAFAAPADTLLVGASAQLAVTVRGATGRLLGDAALDWSSSDSVVVRVDPTGIATARRVGAADVVATSGGRRATLRLVVVPVPVAAVTFEAPPAELAVGSVRQLVATARDSAGGALPGRPIAYRSSDPAVAATSAGGVLTALRVGAATVTAESEGRTASFTVSVVAAAAAAAPAPVPAPPLPPDAGDGSYGIRVSWDGTPDPRASAVVDAVVSRWRRAITGDLPNVALTTAADACWEGQTPTQESIDDLLVYVRVVHIDGPSGTLARAGPCYVRAARGLPLVGVVELDSADLSRSAVTVQSVLLHEFGHVLGIGTLWEYRALLHGAGGGDPLFLGATAQASYELLGGRSLVPVENGGGEGTRDGHWRESVFRSELMTGWINAGENPMSAMTIASLRDLGYAVDLGAADAYTLPSRPGASARVEGGPTIRMSDELVTPRFVVDERGRTRRLR